MGLSLLVGVLFLYLAARNVSLRDLSGAFERFDVRWLGPAVLVSLVLQVFRAWRWQLELLPLERISLGRLWLVVSVAYMGINLLPARLGEVLRPWLLSRRSAVSFSNAVGTLLVEKTADAMVIAFYVSLGLLTTPDLPAWVRRGAVFPAFVAALLLLVMALLWWRGEAFLEKWAVRFLPDVAARALLRVLRSVLAGMRILPSPRLVVAVLAVSLALWFLAIVSSYILIRAFHFAVPVTAALMVFIFIGFGTALPQAPGMVGTYQYACVLALGLFGVPEADAFAYGLVLNALQLGTLVAQGLVALAISGISLAEIRRANPRPETPAQAPESRETRVPAATAAAQADDRL